MGLREVRFVLVYLGWIVQPFEDAFVGGWGVEGWGLVMSRA